MSSRIRQRHIPALDGIRGVAILLVMAHHFKLYGGVEHAAVRLDKEIFRFCDSAWVGVDLFFVLSGFLITGILYDTKHSERYFRNFYARRVLRIFPLYYGFLVLLLFVVPMIFRVGPAFRTLLDEQTWYWTYLVNLKIGIEGWPQFFALGHFWSLAVEEQFYLVWPLIVFLLRRRGLMAVCGACLVGSLVFRVAVSSAGYGAPYVLTPARLDSLAVGAWVAIICRGPSGWKMLRRLALPAMAIPVSLLMALIVWKRRLDIEDRHTFTVGLTVIALVCGGAVVLAVASAPTGILRRAFSVGILRFFGRYSYALYIFHHLVAIYLPRWGFAIRDVPTFLGSQVPGFVLFAALGTAISVAAALLSWHLLESRFLALKRFFPSGASGLPIV